ncbi:MAG: TIGR03619 family F420-dependent LLM class oxidoreductase [Sphingomonadales bacterium]|nr:TIGR03619 family F420-dependent LLM class oxidoreductase [Sphingomonadales bacterium]
MLKITLYIGHIDGTARPVEIAKMVEKAGLHGVALGEHVSLGSDISNYPYEGGLAHGDAGRKPYLELAVLNGAIAAVTTRIRISNCIMLAPLRPAVLLAKQLTTIDVISNGRCEPCFGTGWSREEYASLNVDFGKRRQILRDNIGACRALWENQPATFQSETVSFTELHQQPQPVQKRIPILLGVKATPANVKLVAELCDGWESGPDDSASLDKLREGSQMYRDAFVAAGRDPAELIVRAHLPRYMLPDNSHFDLDRIFADVPAMMAAGVTEFATGVMGRLEGPFPSMAAIEDYIGRIAEHAAKF